MEVGGTMGSLIGRVSRNGSVRATGYMGANYGVASGRVGQFRQWNVARSHGKRELRRCLERAATIISHLPPRGLVQTRTATSRYGIFLSGAGHRLGPHTFRQCNDCGEFDRAFAWVHRPAFLSAKHS